MPQNISSTEHGIFIRVSTVCQDKTILHLCPCKIGCQPIEEISILHDHVTAFLHGQIRIFIFPKKGTQRTNILCLSNSKTLRKVKRHLLTSQKGNDVTIRAPSVNTGNMTGYCFAICNLTNAPIMFSIQKQSAYSVYTHFQTR